MNFNMKVYARMYLKTYELSQIPNNREEVQKSLKDVSRYLDLCGIPMPPQKYPYNPKDKSTWKYLDNSEGTAVQALKLQMEDEKGGIYYIPTGTMLNPDYKYRLQNGGHHD